MGKCSKFVNGAEIGWSIGKFRRIHSFVRRVLVAFLRIGKWTS